MVTSEKNFARPEQSLVELVSNSGECFATDRIMVDGCQVGYMYREQAVRPEDTGWRFFAGDETQEYIDDLSHTDVYAVNTVANYDPSILQHLDTPSPCAFERIGGTNRYRKVER